MSGLRFHHLGVVVQRLDDMVDAYRSLFGYRVLSGPVTDPVQRVTVCFLGSDDPASPTVELVCPADRDSPVHGFLAKGIAAYHVCYEVDDLDAALAEVRSRACVVVAPPAPAVAFDGRRIAWFYTPARQLIELVELHPGGCPTPGGARIEPLHIAA